MEHGIGAMSPSCPPLLPLLPLPPHPLPPPLPPSVGTHEDSCNDTLRHAGLVKPAMSPKTSATKSIALATLFLRFGVTLIVCLATSQCGSLSPFRNVHIFLSSVTSSPFSSTSLKAWISILQYFS